MKKCEMVFFIGSGLGDPELITVPGTLKDIAVKIKTAKIARQAMIIVVKTLGATAGSKQRTMGKGQRSKLYDKNFEHGYRKKKD